jgi:hypothetical protein
MRLCFLSKSRNEDCERVEWPEEIAKMTAAAVSLELTTDLLSGFHSH